jgi:hypothetical protein
MENSLLSQFASRDAGRIRRYCELLDFYQGKQWPGREKWGEKRLTFNYTRVFIDKLTSYLMSGINFTVEAIQDTPEARTRAEETEKALSQVYEANGLEQLDYETETDCAILGDACYKVVWSKEFGVRITAPDIRGISVWWMGDDVSRIWRVASRYSLSEEEAEAMGYRANSNNQSPNYKQIPNNNDQITNPTSSPLTPVSQLLTSNSQLHTITEIWTDRTFELYMDNNLLESKANPYGFIPFIIFPKPRSGRE